MFGVEFALRHLFPVVNTLLFDILFIRDLRHIEELVDRHAEQQGVESHVVTNQHPIRAKIGIVS